MSLPVLAWVCSFACVGDLDYHLDYDYKNIDALG